MRRPLVLLVVLGLVLGLGVAELMARALVPPARHYVHDPELGHRLAPDQRSHRTGPRGEFDIWMSTNAHGDPDAERTVDKPPGTYRIAVIGDSIVEASQVMSDLRFTVLLERAWKAVPPAAGPGIDRVEVLNFGVAGYGTAQEWLRYRSHVRRFRPDAVVLAFFPTNDIRNNSYELEVLDARSRSARPFFALDGGRLVRLDPAQHTAAPQGAGRSLRGGVRWVLGRLRIAQVLFGAVREIRARVIPDPDGARRQLRVDLALYDPVAQRQPRWQEAWDISAGLLTGFAADVERDCARFVVALVPGPRETNEASRTVLLAAVGSSEVTKDRYDWTLPHRLAVQMVGSLGLDSVDLYPSMSAAVASGRQTHFTFDGHLTPIGHEVAAEFLNPPLLRLMSSRKCP